MQKSWFPDMHSATEPEVMEILTGIFRDVLDDASLELHESTSAAEVENWDSLNHIDLIVAVEARFGVKFTTKEVSSLQNVGQLARLTLGKLNNGQPNKRT